MFRLTKVAIGVISVALLFSACSKSNNPAPDTENKTKPAYILFTNEQDLGTAGYMSAYSKMPSGNLSNITSNTLQMKTAFGFTKFGNWIFNRTSIAGEAGIQKLEVNDNGKISGTGFIANGGMFHIVSSTVGYYFDPVKGTMLLQIFNPTTMQRTGEIDLSSLKITGVEYQAAGQHIIASKEGKLYVSITYGTLQRGGYGDDVVDYVKLAVIDIATNKLEKTIQYNGLKSLGWGASANKMWTLGDDGALYLYYTGFNEGITNSSIIRIKKNETDFDKTWILKADTYQEHSSIGISLVKNGKIYIQLPSVKLTADFGNLGTPIWNYYAIDISTLKQTKITGMPATRYVHSNEQGIVEIDGKIYLWMANANTKENGYYLLNESNNTAAPAFNVTDGGLVSGFFKLDN
ncbi:hypothetical protein DVR12_02215 [Chitinophaga silvatica]|uniref:DUF4374 domain-containing protein n=1 Tax=Chitinophaga silvatica TaxID=2282649 RepID=A0A3E1YGZ0_9BACT|nr:hypothetical protein [Chitinophaga silvatica]RFS26624.1 hypothetical protein DVR12_02215 [Chitinophaga silvatica]